MYAIAFIIGLLTGAAGALFVAWVLSRKSQNRISKAKEAAEAIVKEADNKAEAIRKEAQHEAKEMEARAHEYETETRRQRADLQKFEQRLLKKDENIERKSDLLTAKELELQAKEKKLSQKEQDIVTAEGEITKAAVKAREVLERNAGMSSDEAKRTIVAEVIGEARLEAAREIRTIEEETKSQAEAMSKKILSTVISRYAGEFVAERVVSVVSIPSEEMKGRIIGREGRNIRAFEAATGVDLIIDDTPEAVVVSAFSGVRREVARLSLERLLADGRIHPSRIEEVVKKTEAEVDGIIKQAGERACMELGIYGMHAELVKQVGRLKYRTSYGQNVLAHSMEVAYLAGLLAGELGDNVKVARRAGLLHDIGKVVEQDQEGPHHVVGAQMAKKFGEVPAICHSIRAHHEEPETVLDHIVIAADAISGARPGARRELLENYLKRLDDLEAIPKSFKGVQEAYAFQAGREIRVLVNPDHVSDAELVVLCRDIAHRIETELTYPGRIKVAVLRQTRTEEFAK